jgi:DNA-binding IclR family transcriptional regulator
MEQDDGRLKLVPAVERAVRLLDLVARNRTYLTLSDISRELGIAKSTVYTLCNTLVQLKLLIRRSDQTFRLGPHVMRWSNAFNQQSDVAAEFASMWDQQTELPGATITLSVLEGPEVVYIAARNSEASHSLINFRAGMRLPAAFTATGKSFLSYMTEIEVRKLYANGLPPPRTPYSVQSIDSLIKELEAVRENGYSVDNQQVAEGIVCYGASVLNSRNQPIAGVAVSLLAEKFSEQDQNLVIANVQRIATRLSHRMGADIDAEDN